MKLLAGLLLLLGTSFGARAQQTTAPAAAAAAPTDSGAYVANRFISFIPGQLELLDGRIITGYMPVTTMYPGLDFEFIYYLTHPDRKPKPEKQEVRMQDVKRMTAGSHYLEPMRLPGEKVKIMAERFVNGPVEVFLQADQKSVPIIVPLPSPILMSGIPYTKSHFFVRRNGVLTQVDRGMFYMQMSQYLADYPELAKRIAHAEKGYHYKDLLRLVSSYNQFTANLQSAGRPVD